MPLTAEVVWVIDGHSDRHASNALAACGEGALRVIREASRAGCSEMSPGEVVNILSSLLPRAGFVQYGRDGLISIGFPNEILVKVAKSALREVFFHRLLSHEVMCS